MKTVWIIMLMSATIGVVVGFLLKLLKWAVESEWYSRLLHSESWLVRLAVIGVVLVCAYGSVVIATVGVFSVFVRIPCFRRVLQWRAAEQPALITADGRKRLRYEPSYRSLGWMAVVLALVCFAAAGADPGESLREKLILGELILGVLCGVAGVALIVAHRRFLLDYDADGLRYVPAWSREASFAWSDVQSVTYSKRRHRWELKLKNGRKAGVGLDMLGALEFMQTLAERTGVEVPQSELRKPAP